MDGETPSWLEEGTAPSPPAEAPTSAAATAPAAPPTAPPTGAFSLDDKSAPATTAASPGDAAAARDAPATDNVARSILGSAGAEATAATTAAAAAGGAKEEDLPRLILSMRVLNMAAAALLITCSVFTLIPGGTHISVWVMSIYAMCGGTLVCCLETQLKFVRTIIAMNFGFLFNSVYRFFFYCLMASVAWSYGGLLAWITSITLVVVACFNTYVLCRYPAYRRMREKVAAEEDQRIQAKINQQVRTQALRNMGWGKN